MDKNTRKYGEDVHHVHHNDVKGRKHHKEDSGEPEGKAYDGNGKIGCAGLAAIIVGKRAVVQGQRALILFPITPVKSIIKEGRTLVNIDDVITSCPT